MSDERGLDDLYNSRRQILRTVSGLAALGFSSVVASDSVVAEPGNQQWAFETDDEIHSSPTVVDGTVFVGSNDGNLYAVDAETGNQRWAFRAGGLFELPVESSPTVVDGTVFVGSNGGNLYAVDAETGNQQWAFETGGNQGYFETGGLLGFSVESSPTVVDGTVFAGSNDSNLYAVDAMTGTEQWAFETGDWVTSSPTVVDGTVFVGSHDGSLYAVDAETGNQQWAFDTGGVVESSPTVVDGTIFVGSNDNTLYAVDSSTGEEEWVFDTGGFVESSPTVVDGTVFVGSSEDYLYAVDAETGDQQWDFVIARDVESSPTVVAGTVYVSSEGGDLYAIDAETGQEKWTFGTTDSVYSSPIVVDGTVFVGSSDGTLYAIDAGVSGSSEGSRTMLGTLGHHNNWQHANQSISIPWHTLYYSLFRNNLGFITLGAVIGVTGYGIRRYRSTNSADSNTATELQTTAEDREIRSDIDTNIEELATESAIEDTTINSNHVRERTIEALLTQAEEAENSGQYQRAVDTYEKATNIFEQVTTEVDKEELEIELREIQTAHDRASAVNKARESVSMTLQAAEQSFNEAIARYAAGNLTVARLRFRQARDSFKEAHQLIEDSDTKLLTHPIEVGFELEAALPSIVLEELAVLDESTVEKLAAVNIESITDLEPNPEEAELPPAVVHNLQQRDELNDEEAALLTMLSWYYEGDSREFATKDEISRRSEQADYGFDQST